MLPSFVIGLREGLEASLIIGIIAAFLRKQGRRDLLRAVMVGVGVAVLLCLGIGIALRAYSQNLPQKQQEGLETVVAVLAVGMVTYMVVWMRRNSRGLKGQLEGLAGEAMNGRANAGRAMVLMAFLAVIREGLETVVFLLAAFNEAANGAAAGGGATLGILVAVGLGYGIYRGGVKLNLSKFFRFTGVVLVLVAAGLVVNAFHTAHEAGWLDAGQGRVADLSWLVQPGTVQASLLTGMLGLQPRPVVVEVLGWLAYLIPVGLYVAWPPGRRVPTRAAVRGGLAVAALAGVGAVVLAAIAPSTPAAQPTTRAQGLTAQVVSRSGPDAVVRTQQRQPSGGQVGATSDVRVSGAGFARHSGVDAQKYTVTTAVAPVAGRPARLADDRIAQLNGSRFPIGIQATGGTVPVTYRDALTLTVWLDVRTDRVLDLSWHERVFVVAGTATNNVALAQPLDDATFTLPAASSAQAAAAAQADHSRLTDRSHARTAAQWCVGLAVVALLVALGFWIAARRRAPVVAAPAEPVGQLVRS